MNWTGFYINLDRDEARRRAVEAELGKIEAGGYRRFAAVDGSTVSLRPDLSSRGEIGCMLSHLEIIRSHVGHKHWLHVVEDDALVSRNARAGIDMLLSLPFMNSCDILFNNVLLPLDNYIVSPFREAYDKIVDITPDGNVTSIKSVEVMQLDRVDFLLTTSYLINPHATKRVAELLEVALQAEPFVPIDGVYQKLSRSGVLNTLCTIPFLTIPRMSGESSIRPNLSIWRLSHMIMETALYADRDVSELRRVLAALKHQTEPSVTSELIAEAYRYSIDIHPYAPVSF